MGTTFAQAGIQTEPLPNAPARMASEVAAGLLSSGQKTLPCKYLYDRLGSILFEAICALPEYGLTAADGRLLRRHASAILQPFRAGDGGAAEPPWIVELGSGNGQKTRWILEAASRQAQGGRVRYMPIEVSEEALEQCRRALEAIPNLEIRPFTGEYLAGLAALRRRREEHARRGPVLVLFLGSSLGNFSPADQSAFLQGLRRQLRPGDGFVLGLDLAGDREKLCAAYDDPAGVTAAFNRNLLARLNRELGADFDLRNWQHRVRYRRRERRIEMHLRSRRDQTVTIPAAEARVHFRRGETIWTESSQKFRAGEIAGMAERAGFRLEAQWIDAEWPFSENLLVAV